MNESPRPPKYDPKKALKCRHDNYLECEAFDKDNKPLGIRYVCMDCGFMSSNKCEVYSRVVGYLRPVDSYNIGKQEEFRTRKTFKPFKRDYTQMMGGRNVYKKRKS